MAVDKNSSLILEGLDPQQKAAVLQMDGPVLIVAGAGSGKTRVLTSRIAYTLEQGVDPSRILALTFTKKAAGEMKERIAGMVGKYKATKLWMGTFHSVFIRFLREYASSLGYPSSFTIYDTSDSQSAIKRIVKEMQLDDKTYKPKDVLSRISNAKNNLVTVQAYKSNPSALQNDAHSKKPRIADIYEAYQNALKAAGVMDFDDILMNMNLLLHSNKEALEDIRKRFDYILVDEYQDTNFAQFRIIQQLGAVHKNVCVVGDDSQSIYAFRGAKIENILNFRKFFPEAKVFRLERNYRSTRTIVNAANSLIEKNEGRIPKKCFSEGDEGEKIHLIQGFTELEEARLVAASIVSRMQKDHAQYQDFAILYRTNAQSRALEEELRKYNLPYVIFSGNSFFDRVEVKDMMAYFKLAVNPSDDESFRRVVNKPARGIGDTTVAALSAAAKAHGVPLIKAIYLDDLEASGLRKAAILKLKTFSDLILEANSMTRTKNAMEVAKKLQLGSGLYHFFKDDLSVESQSRAGNIEELINSVGQFIEDRNNDYLEELAAEEGIDDTSAVDPGVFPMVSLGDYLENISLLSSVDAAEGDDLTNRVTLMTVHSAKGLEYPYVYVTGLEENLFPSMSMASTANDLEEERRLFYVAITRAKVAVDLCFANSRMRNGSHESNSPSRFIREIDPRYIANPLRKGPSYDDDGDDEGYASGGSGRWGQWRAGGGNSSQSKSSWGEKARSGGWQSSSAPQRSSSPSKVGVSSVPKISQSQRVAKTPPPADPNFIPVPISMLREGQRIEHNRFGLGTIISMEGNATDRKAKINFDLHGEKTLLLQYAKIRFPKEK